jgi:histidinol dehydrogenase
MRIFEGKEAELYVRSQAKRGARLESVEPVVRKIIEDVRSAGDTALLKYARRFDGLTEDHSLRVTPAEMKSALKHLAPELRSAIGVAQKNIRRFCEWQKPSAWSKDLSGISLGQIVRPLDSVGCYVPGGRFPLLSTMLMTVIPAQVAGVKNITVASPKASGEVLAAAAILGVKTFVRAGGAQAIAGLAYGTESVARVDKIVGPGNLYVTAAKKLVSFDCSIDMLAGPTEVVIVSNTGNPEFVAADLIAQAEHDPETLAVFITTSRRLAAKVDAVMSNNAALPKNGFAADSISSRGAILLAASRQQAFEWSNRIAPEHITVEKRDLPLVHNAGSIFVGDYSAQAAGDYASGPNHVLPTAGAARFRGGLSVMDFVKIITVQDLSSQGLRKLAPSIVTLAQTEGLHAHAESIRARFANA